MSEVHVRRGHPITFGILVLFSIITVAISTWLVNTFNRNDNYPNRSIRDRSRFLLFTSWWTFVFGTLYLIGFQTASNSAVTSIASHGTWIAITWLFWLAGAAALSDALPNNCSGILIHCSQLKALEAFSWIIFIILTLLLGVISFLGFKGIRRGDRLSGTVAA